VADKLVDMLVPMVQALKVGRPEDNADITPVISDSSANFIQGLVEDARQKGEPPGGWGAGRAGGLGWDSRERME